MMNTPPKRSNKWSTYAKYSSIGFQLAGLIGLSLFFGFKVDRYFNFDKIPVFTISFILLTFVGFIYKLMKELSEK